MRLVRALFDTPYDDVGGFMYENDLFPADDPLVLKHPTWFTDDLDVMVRHTTVAPEVPPKRGPGRPPKTEPRTTAVQEIVEARP